MRKLLTGLVVTVLLGIFATPASAVTWQYYDFGTQYFDFNNNYSPVSYPNGIGNLPGPGLGGEGGEKYDIEGMNFAFDDTYMYMSMTSSFGDGVYSTTYNYLFKEGDLFFGFDGNKYDFAIDVQSGKLMDVTSWNYVPDIPGGYGGNAIIKNAVGAYEVGGGTILGNVDKYYSFYAGLESNPLLPGDGDTYIKEYRFLLSDLGVNPMTKSYITIHSTKECGNDLGEEDHGIVPEPGTMILLGMGLLGMGAVLCRKN